MITLLRKIRKRLIDKGSFSSYFLYAIGEILLVVVGILIALQINNWNEERKQNDLEQKLLVELRNTIIDDYRLLNMAINGNRKTQESCAIILSHLEQNLPYHDTLALHFENSNLWWRMLVRKNVFEKAKLFGLDFITNDTTKNMLSDLFEKNVAFGETMDERQSLFHFNTVTPILIKLFESIDKTWYQPKNGNVPIDYEALRMNEEYKSILRTTIGQRGYYNEWINLTLSNMQELEKKLLEEIEYR